MVLIKIDLKNINPNQERRVLICDQEGICM